MSRTLPGSLSDNHESGIIGRRRWIRLAWSA